MSLPLSPSRRSFCRIPLAGAASLAGAALVTGASTALASAAPRAAAAEAKAKAAPSGRGLKLGVASYSYRKLSLDKMIEACRAADIKYVTVKDVHVPQTDSPEAIRAACDKIREAGLTILGGGVINMKAADEAAIRKNFEYAKLCAFPLIVASPVIEALDLVEAMVKEYGIPVAIHNHGPEDKLYPAPKDVLAHLKKRDERMGVCMDIGHTVRAGADPARSAAECGRRLLDLHIKDLRDLKVKESQVAAGRGAIDLVALLRQLHKMKFQGHVAVEYEVDADAPEAGVRESMGYLRGVAAALGAA